jgi:O-antigen ligase
MYSQTKDRQISWWKNEEMVYSFLCGVIVFSLLFWSLLTNIFIILLFVYWLFVSKKNFSTPTNNKWVVLFGSLFFIAIISAIFSSNTTVAIHKLVQKSPILLFPLVFGTINVLTPVVFKRIFNVFVWSTFLGCLFCVANGIFVFLTTGSTDKLHGYNIVALKSMSGFFLGLCCLLSIIYLAIKLYKNFPNRETFRSNYFDGLILIALFAFLFLLGNRNILFYITCLIIFFSFKLVPGIKHRIIILASLVLIFFLTIVINPFLNRQWKDLTDFSKENAIQLDKDQSLGRGWGGKTIRLAIWECSLDILKANWLTGVGIGDSQDELQNAYEKRQFYFASRYNKYNAHNQYIQQAIASGLAGLLVFLACILIPLFYFIRQKDKLIYTLFLFCFAFICVTESVLEISKGVIWYSFFNSIFVFNKKTTS